MTTHTAKAGKEEKEFTTGESFAELFAASEQNKVEEGSVTAGRVVSIEKDAVVIDVGLKSEGRVSIKEFPPEELKALQANDEIDVFVENFENRQGEAVLSRERAIQQESWSVFEKAHKAEKTVDGVIFGAVKGGYTVDLGGTVAFLPGSQVDVRPIKDIGPLMNLKQPFMILKMDRKRGNIVVSRRAIMEESRSAERDEMLSNITEGSVLEGVVKNVTDYGAFVDLGAIDGLLHVTDISWSRINHPSEVLNVNDKITVKVIKYDEANKRVSLGLKQLTDSPWADVESRYAVGSKYKGKVTNITDYGAFVELDKGVEGLVHVSEMSWTKKNLAPGKIVSLGEEVEVVILDVDPVKHRLSLGMKQCADNPWEDFAKKHPVGSTVKGVIKNVADFGVFVGFEGDIDGLIHVSDIAWEGNSEEALKNFQKDEEVEVKILSLEPEKERISLGLKQLSDDPFGQAISGLKKGDVSTFAVSAVQEDGIEVKVADGLVSFIKKGDLAYDRVERRPDRFAVGDRVDAQVVSVNKAARKVSLSIKALEEDAHKKAVSDYGSASSGASLGDILGVALNDAKKEAAEKKPEAEKKPAAKKPAEKTEEKAKPAAKKPAAKKAPAKAKKDAKKEDK